MFPMKPFAVATATAFSCTLSVLAPAQAQPVDWTSPTLVDARGQYVLPGSELPHLPALRPAVFNPDRARGQQPVGTAFPTAYVNRPFVFEGQELNLDQFLEQTRTNALLVIQDGAIVHEQYRKGMTPDSRHTIFSMSKSIIATLMGIALEDGVIGSLDDKVTDYLPAMAGSG